MKAEVLESLQAEVRARRAVVLVTGLVSGTQQLIREDVLEPPDGTDGSAGAISFEPETARTRPMTSAKRCGVHPGRAAAQAVGRVAQTAARSSTVTRTGAPARCRGPRHA